MTRIHIIAKLLQYYAHATKLRKTKIQIKILQISKNKEKYHMASTQQEDTRKLCITEKFINNLLNVNTWK